MGADLVLDPTDLEKSFAPGRNFATKLWNIGRFLLTNVGDEAVSPVSALPAASLTRADRWILAKLDEAIRDCDAALGPARPEGSTWEPAQFRAGLRLNEYTEAARRFVWNELADWYLESTKARLATPGADRDVARAVLVHVFDQGLRLLHPVVPFITEALWQRLPIAGRAEDALLCVAAWPTPSAGAFSTDAADFELVRDAINALRTLRSDYNVAPSKFIDASIAPRGNAAVYTEEAALIGRLARTNVTVVSAATDDATAAHTLLPDGSDVAVPLGGIVDIEKECAKLRAELAQLEPQLAALSARLANPGFTGRAPAHVIEGERTKEREWTTRRDQMRAKIQGLCGA